jgi:hypothetical protein
LVELKGKEVNLNRIQEIIETTTDRTLMAAFLSLRDRDLFGGLV